MAVGKRGQTETRPVGVRPDRTSRQGRPPRRRDAPRMHEPEAGAWQLHGACREVDGILFFGPEGESHTARTARVRAAKRVCAGCPVLEHCRTYALENREGYGVWGGLAPEERRVLTDRT